MSETIHDAVRRTLDAIKAHDGEQPESLQIRHTNTPPYNVGLYCHECQGYVFRWLIEEGDVPILPGRITSEVSRHACWQPKPTGGEATEATEDADGRERLVSLLALWFDLPEDSPEVQGPIDAFAHELAAKQRKALKDYIDYRGDGVGWPKELEEWVIDPIDPEAQR